jgi:hypothetical protein
MSGHGIHRCCQAATTVGFLAVLWLPLAGRVLPISPNLELVEKRTLAPLPEVRLDLEGVKAFPDRFDAYFEDHFEFRPLLVQSYNRLKSRVEGMEVANLVLVGKEGWYYITEADTLADYRGLIRLDKEELAAIQARLEENRDRLAALGIHYLFAIAPAKWEIYPEFVPDRFERYCEDSVLCQVTRRLQQHSDLEWVDLRRPLLAAKADRRMYERDGTHWTEFGIFEVTQAINARLAAAFPSVTVRRLEEYRPGEKSWPFGDLGEVMGLYRDPRKTAVHLYPRFPQSDLVCIRDADLPSNHRIFENPDRSEEGSRALVFHDSFGAQLYGFLSYSFHRTYYVWDHRLDFDLIEKEKPIVVIHEVGQRGLRGKLLPAP